MLTKQLRFGSPLMAILVLGSSAFSTAQAQDPPGESPPLIIPGHRYDLPATLIRAGEIEEHQQNMIAAGATDIPMNMVEMGGASEDYQVGVSLVVRYEGQTNPNYAVHDDVAEVYYVLQGRGQMKVGGTITDWTRRPYSAGNGWGSRGTTAVGSEDITIQEGDMLIIPAGTPHKWEFAEELTSYVVVRVDPEGVAPLMQLGTAEFGEPGASR